MTLYDRDAFNFYVEGMKKDNDYQVFPMDVSQFSHKMESIYTCRRRCRLITQTGSYFAIGKVKEH